MSAKGKFLFDESKLRPGQRVAAMGLVEREFSPKDQRKTKVEIAEEAGVTVMGMWKWETQDPNFIAYKNYLASEMMDSHLPLVYGKLLGIINQGNAKGIEMFLKRIGDLDSKQEVVMRTGADEEQTFDQRRAELLARLAVASDVAQEEGLINAQESASAAAGDAVEGEEK